MNLRRVVAVALSVVATGIVILGAMNPTNLAETSANHADERLRSRLYNTTPQDLEIALLAIVPRLRTYGRAWKIKSNEQAQVAPDGVLMIEVPVVIFTDDLRVTWRQSGDKVLCDVRSQSRVGRGDFGENRRHVLQLLHALDAEVQGSTLNLEP